MLHHETVVEGARLGVWLDNRRQDQRRGRLASWLMEELERVPGFAWSVVARHHQRALAAVTVYIRRHGWRWLGAGRRIMVDGINIGAWVTNRRNALKRGTLSAGQASAVEAIPGWSWDPVGDAHWAQDLLQRVVAVHRGDHHVVDELAWLGDWFRAAARKPGQWPPWRRGGSVLRD
jgi:hypothetical protein